MTRRWERPARDDELRGLGFEKCTAGDGRSFYFKLKDDAKPGSADGRAARASVAGQTRSLAGLG